jgi:Uma2 family endonuclease
MVGIAVEDLHRLSLDEYHRLIDAGAFERAPVELIDGLLAEMSPKSRAHENAVAWLARWLMSAVPADSYEVRVASPLTIGGSEPEPDLAVIRLDAPRPYHPASAALVVEVAASSLERDLNVKPSLYAASAVAEYWVLDLDGERVVVFSDPRDGAYRGRTVAGANASVAAGALALPELDVATLLRVARA